MLRGSFRNGQVAHAALHHGSATVWVHLQDFVELGQRQRDAQLVRHGTATQARACATRHHGHAEGMAGFQGGLYLCVGFWQRDHQRALTVSRQAITFIRRGVFVVPQQGVLGQHRLQCPHDLVLPVGSLQQVVLLF